METERDLLGRLTLKSAEEVNEILSASFAKAVGGPLVRENLLGRIQRVKFDGRPQETYTLDGKPIVEFWPVELETVQEGNSFVMRATQKYRTF